MHRSNRIHLLLGILAVLAAAFVWVWNQDFDPRLKAWASWVTAGYGALAGFLTWLHGLRCARLIEDIPTSRIDSAAQGYTELLGHAAEYDGQCARKLYGIPVLWFRREVAVRASRWTGRPLFPFNLVYTPVETEESMTPFAIDDGTGTACILPHGAEVISCRREVSYHGTTRTVEERILPGDPLYAVGHFSSYSEEPDLDRAAFSILRQWEKDPPRRAKFDQDRNGRLDEKEWLEMHRAARLEAIQSAAASPPASPHHLMRAPDNGQPFLISSVAPDRLAGRYRAYLLLGLALLLSCSGILAAFALDALTS